MAEQPAVRTTVALDPTASRLVIVEDHALLCDLLAKTLRQEFTPAALHAFVSGREALQQCRREPVDLLFTDLGLPDLDGRELIRQVRARAPKTRVIVLTGKIDGALPAELIALGVAGFVDKSAPLEHAVRAVQRVLAGGMYFFAGVMPAGSGLTGRPGAGPGPELLSEREREVVRLVAGALSSKEIGRQLCLSTRTVENHRARAMQKLGVRDAVSLARWCLERGLG